MPNGVLARRFRNRLGDGRETDIRLILHSCVTSGNAFTRDRYRPPDGHRWCPGMVHIWPQRAFSRCSSLARLIRDGLITRLRPCPGRVAVPEIQRTPEGSRRCPRFESFNPGWLSN
jgi:hypothetical protein